MESSPGSPVSLAERKIVIVSTHVVSDIAGIAKEILLLKQGEIISQQSPAELIHQINGTVWEVSVSKADLPLWQSQYRISNMAYDGSDFSLRLLSDNDVPGGHQVKPNLEDVYLSYFGE